MAAAPKKQAELKPSKIPNPNGSNIPHLKEIQKNQERTESTRLIQEQRQQVQFPLGGNGVNSSTLNNRRSNRLSSPMNQQGQPIKFTFSTS